MNLGSWALIDIETTGLDPLSDEIIDIGYLQFSDTKLIKTFSSLVRPQHSVSRFISKLTGITNQQLEKAPKWESVLEDLSLLEGHFLIAHNANFEEKFLSQHFHKFSKTAESYQDSLLYLSLIFPFLSSLKLENFIRDFKIAEKEMHRGFEDSKDLLKVLLMATALTHHDKELRQELLLQLNQFDQKVFWFKAFLNLNYAELIEIATQIDFDLEECLSNYKRQRQVQASTNQWESASQPISFDSKTINYFLGEESKLQKINKDFKFRSSQRDLALRVGQAFKNDIHAIIQAPTGTGKTLGYLLPAALYSLTENQPVLIATGTKALQNQAIEKDIPLLRELIEKGQDQLKVTSLIGSNNHYCEAIFRSHLDERNLLSTQDFENEFTFTFFQLVFFHNGRNEYQFKINRLNIPFILKRIFNSFNELEKKLAVDCRGCTGFHCPFKNECSYYTGSSEAKESHLVIGNHALMFSWPKSIELPKKIIIDEAHKLESEATRAFQSECSASILDLLVKSLAKNQGIGSLFYLLGQYYPETASDKINSIKNEIDHYNSILINLQEDLKNLSHDFFVKLPRYQPPYQYEVPFLDKKLLKSPLEKSIRHRFESLQHVLTAIEQLLTPYTKIFAIQDLRQDNEMQAWTRFENFYAQIEDQRTVLSDIFKEESEHARIYSYSEEKNWSLLIQPIDIGKVMLEQILESRESVIYTSATLANQDGSLGSQGVEWVTGYYGVSDQKRFQKPLFLPPQFNYREQSRTYLCADVPSIHDSNYVNFILEQTSPIVKLLAGRTLYLFSSRVRFEKAVELLLEMYEPEISVFIQGMGEDIVNEFMKKPHSVLIGMESFGEGIDIPGDALQFLVIDKIPDLRMDLVVNQRRDFYQKSFGNEFRDYYLANRCRLLQQKLGRLIRRESDKGAAIIFDQRCKRWKGATVKTFRQLIEPYQLEFVNINEAITNLEEYYQSLAR